MKRILCIDGGGMRGIVALKFLVGLEEVSGLSCAELFDAGCGTSTGGIGSLGLFVPGPDGKPKYTAAQLLDLYVKRGHDIFTRSIAYEAQSVDGALLAKYQATGIESVMAEYFDTAVLGDCLKDVLVTSFDCSTPEPVHFTKRDHPKMPVAVAARATSAAPTYFAPLEYLNRCLIDGGVWGNNPSPWGWAMGRQLWPSEELLVVSVGCGSNEVPVPAGNWGIVEWTRPLVDILLEAGAQAAHQLMGQILPADRYYRFQCKLGGVGKDMDDASPGNIAALERIGAKMADDFHGQVRLLSSVLSR